VVEKIPDLPDNILGFSATGTVTAHDYESIIIPAVEAQKQNAGSASSRPRAST